MTTSNNIRLCFLFLLFCCNGNIFFSTAELTEDIIVAKELAWARRSIEDYNRMYRLHPLTNEIKYELPSSKGNVDKTEEDYNGEIDTSSRSIGVDLSTTDGDGEPMKLYLRGRGGAESRPT
jgi:hypothetical protein